MRVHVTDREHTERDTREQRPGNDRLQREERNGGVSPNDRDREHGKEQDSREERQQHQPVQNQVTQVDRHQRPGIRGEQTQFRRQIVAVRP